MATVRDRCAATLAALGLMLLSGVASAEIVRLRATLAAAPPNTASGAADLQLDTEVRLLTFRLVHDGLSGPATAGRIGRAGDPAAAPVVVLVRPVSPIVGSKSLAEGEAAELLAGRLVIEIATEAAPGGEIAGRIEPVAR